MNVYVVLYQDMEDGQGWRLFGEGGEALNFASMIQSLPGRELRGVFRSERYPQESSGEVANRVMECLLRAGKDGLSKSELNLQVRFEAGERDAAMGLLMRDGLVESRVVENNLPGRNPTYYYARIDGDENE